MLSYPEMEINPTRL